MKKLIRILCLACAPVAFTSCQITPATRQVIAVQSLKSVGQTAEAALTVSAQLYHDGKITAAEARAVNDFFDSKFEPAFRFASSVARANRDSVASPNLVSLASQLASLVAQYQTK